MGGGWHLQGNDGKKTGSAGNRAKGSLLFLQGEAHTEELGFRYKFCPMNLHPSGPTAQLAQAELGRKEKGFT